jgi:Protein of unknown function (DUF1559)
MTATSRHPGGVNLILGDGSYRFIKQSINPTIWMALGTVAGQRQMIHVNRPGRRGPGRG